MGPGIHASPVALWVGCSMARPPPLPGHTAGDRSPVLPQHQGPSGRTACRRQSRHGTRQAPHVSLWPRRDLNGTAAPPTPTPSPGPELCAEPFLRPKPGRRETAGLRQLTLTTSEDSRWPLRRHLPLPWILHRFAGHLWCARYRARKADTNKKHPPPSTIRDVNGSVGRMGTARPALPVAGPPEGRGKEGFAEGVAFGSDLEKRMNVHSPGRGRRERDDPVLKT